MSNIQENFEEYKKLKEEYQPKQPMAVQVFGTEDFNNIILEKNEHGVPVAGKTIFKDQEFLNQFNPNNIDVQQFWQYAADYFPEEAMAGINNVEYENEEELKEKVNNETFNSLHVAGGAIDYVNQLFYHKPNANFLEIGCGYGGILDYISKYYPNSNIFATDVVKLVDYSNFELTDGWTIPFNAPMDMVYSINVFQHLCHEQRIAYYDQVYDILRDDGIFLFGMNMVTEENKNSNLWGTQDNNGNYYTRFFNQFVEVSHINDVYDHLYSAGFSQIERVHPHGDIGVYEILKIKK